MKSLTKNTIYAIAYRFLNIVFPLITTAYVSRILLPAGIGKVASAQNIVTYFIIISSLGIPTYGIKRIAQCGSDIEKRSKAFWELYTINFFSSLICFSLYLATIFNLDYFDNKVPLSLALGIQILLNIFNIDWLYQGIENYRFIAICNFTVKIVSLLLVLLFIRRPTDYVLYACILTVGSAFNYLLNMSQLHKYVRFAKQRLCFKQHLKPVFVLLASSLAIEIYTLVDTTMLNLLKGDTIVAYYQPASKTIAILRSLIAAICVAYLPRLSYYYNEGEKEKFIELAKRGVSILLLMSIPVAIGTFFVADDFVLIIFGKEYTPAISAIKILSISAITITLSNFTGYQVFVTTGREKYVLISTILGAIINIILNSLLIIRYNHNGAAVASVVTEAFVTIYQLIKIKQFKINIFNIKHFIKTIIATFPMIIVLYSVRQVVQQGILRFIICIFAGVILYFSAILLINKNLVTEIINNFRFTSSKSNLK